MTSPSDQRPMPAAASPEPGQRLRQAMAGAKDDDVGQLLHALDATFKALRVDNTYLAEAMAAEQKRVAELQRQNEVLRKGEANALRNATLQEQAADRFEAKIVELERQLDGLQLRAETDRLEALTERDSAVETLTSRLRTVEAENQRLRSELADLRRGLRPYDLAVDRYADPSVVLVVDGDQLVVRGWGNLPISVGRSRALAALGRLADQREAPVDVLFSSPEALDDHALNDSAVRVRVLSDWTPMAEALLLVGDSYGSEAEVAVITDQADVPEAVSTSRLMDLLGMPAATPPAATTRSGAAQRPVPTVPSVRIEG